MNEAKTNQEEVLKIFKSEYEGILLKMNENYEQFFCWHGGTMYKIQINLKAIRELRHLTSWDSTDKIKMALENHIRNIELTLIEGSQYPTSTNLLHNVADVLGREAKQRLREDLQRLLYTITYK